MSHSHSRFIPDSPVDDTFDPTEVAGPMFLHEVGGNIGEVIRSGYCSSRPGPLVNILY